MDAEIESRESDSSERSHAHPRRTTDCILLGGRFRARDQPDRKDGKGKAADHPTAGRSLQGDVHHRGDGSAYQRRDRCGQAHLAGGQRLIKDGEREASRRPGDYRPDNACSGREYSMLSQGNAEHQNERADVRERGEHEGVGAAGPISSSEISCAPEKYSDHAVDCGRELGHGGHAGRG